MVSAPSEAEAEGSAPGLPGADRVQDNDHAGEGVEDLQAKHASVMRKLHGFGRQRAKPLGSKSKLLLRKSLLERIRACQETSAGGSIAEGSLLHAGNVTKSESCGAEPTATPRLTDELKFRKRNSGVQGISWVVARKANCVYWSVNAQMGRGKGKYFSVQRYIRQGSSFEKAVEKALTDAKVFYAGHIKQGGQKRCYELSSAEPVKDAGAVAAPSPVDQSTHVLVRDAGGASASSIDESTHVEAASVEDSKHVPAAGGLRMFCGSQPSATSKLAEEPSSQKRHSGVKGITWMDKGNANAKYWLVQKMQNSRCQKTLFPVKQYMRIGTRFETAVEKALAAAKAFHAGHTEQVKQGGLKKCLERPSAELVGHAEVASEHASADQNANVAEATSVENMEEKCRRLELDNDALRSQNALLRDDNLFLSGLHNHVLMQFQLRTERLRAAAGS